MDASSTLTALLGSAKLARSTKSSIRARLNNVTTVPQVAPRLLSEINEVANGMDVLRKSLSCSHSATEFQGNSLLSGYLDVVLSTSVLLFNELTDLNLERSKRPPKWWNRPDREVGEILERLGSSKDCIQTIIGLLGL